MTQDLSEIMDLSTRAGQIEARQAELSHEITRLCLHADPGIDVRPRVQALHTERDALDAELAGLRNRMAEIAGDEAAAKPVAKPRPFGHFLRDF